MKLRTKLALLLVPAVLGVTALVGLSVSSATGSTTPKWYIGGTEMAEKTTESYGGVAEPSSMSGAGITTSCQHAYYVANIFNSSGLGKGELTSLPLYECSASGWGCEVSKVEAKSLPWSMHTVFVESKPYLVIEGVHVAATYSGFFCPLKGAQEATGSVGGALENATQTVIFNKSSASATGASLKLGGSTVEYAASYTAEDVGYNYRGQLVEAK